MNNRETIKIKIAKNSGFCFGVKRAVNIVEGGLKKYKNLSTMGPLIHNPQIVKYLNKRGLQQIKHLPKNSDVPIVIRSHGMEKNRFNRLKRDGITLLDTTCPYVSKAQKFVEEYDKMDYKIVIFGDEDHPEVTALKSYSKTPVYVINNQAEVPEGIGVNDKVVALSQTTKIESEFKNIVEKLKKKVKNIKVLNTICKATQIRQRYTSELAKKSELMVVVGGKNSANTKMLAKISQKYTETLHIETADEIKQNDITGKFKIGITAGASTPDWVIKKVYKKISKMAS